MELALGLSNPQHRFNALEDEAFISVLGTRHTSKPNIKTKRRPGRGADIDGK
jgi:hypothetical protein